MGSTNIARVEKGGPYTILRRFLEMKRCYKAERLLKTTHGKMNRLSRRSCRPLYERREQRVLASRDRKQRSEQDGLFPHTTDSIAMFGFRFDHVMFLVRPNEQDRFRFQRLNGSLPQSISTISPSTLALQPSSSMMVNM